MAESVAGALRDAIHQGDYRSGERLIEMTLAQEMNVSQNTVRDALYLLEQQGLVSKKARYGVYVRDYTLDEIEEVYELWAQVEPLALRWALPQLTVEDYRALASGLNSARQRLVIGNHRIDDLLFAFHGLIAQRVDRPQTRALLENLHNQARLLEHMRHLQAPRPLPDREHQLRQYGDLLRALKDKDLTGAQAVLRSHILAEGASLLLLRA